MGRAVTRVSRSAALDLGLVGLLVAAAVVVLADLHPVRPFVLVAAATLVPGGAIVTRLRTGDGLTDLALAIGLSLAVEIAASLALTWTGWWHPAAAALALGAVSLWLLASDLRRERGR